MKENKEIRSSAHSKYRCQYLNVQRIMITFKDIRVVLCFEYLPHSFQ